VPLASSLPPLGTIKHMPVERSDKSMRLPPSLSLSLSPPATNHTDAHVRPQLCGSCLARLAAQAGRASAACV
jgi:hypothetical protein